MFSGINALVNAVKSAITTETFTDVFLEFDHELIEKKNPNCYVTIGIKNSKIDEPSYTVSGTVYPLTAEIKISIISAKDKPFSEIMTVYDDHIATALISNSNFSITSLDSGSVYYDGKFDKLVLDCNAVVSCAYVHTS